MRIRVLIFFSIGCLIGCNESPTSSPSVPPGFVGDAFLGSITYDSSMHSSHVELTIRYHYTSDSGSLKHIRITTSFGDEISEGVRQYAPDPPWVVKELSYKFSTSAISSVDGDATVRATIEGWLVPIAPRDTSLDRLFSWTDSIRVPIR
jgi:hypothetical protein